MRIYSKDLKVSVQEMRRVGTLVNKVRRLIELSQDDVPLSRDESRARTKIQREIEEICGQPLHPAYINLGKVLDGLPESGCTLTLVDHPANADVSLMSDIL